MPPLYTGVSLMTITAINDALQRGEIGIIPTDTVYGIVARLHDHAAVQRMYKAKPRTHSAGTIMAASIEDLVLAGFPEEPLLKVSFMWPGAVSVVVDAANVAQAVKKERTSLPVRIPDSEYLRSILRHTGPLVTTSANHHNEPTATAITDAMRVFGSNVDFYVDGGDLSGRPPSTIIGFNSEGGVIVYRQGAVSIDKE